MAGERGAGAAAANAAQYAAAAQAYADAAHGAADGIATLKAQVAELASALAQAKGAASSLADEFGKVKPRAGGGSGSGGGSGGGTKSPKKEKDSAAFSEGAKYKKSPWEDYKGYKIGYGDPTGKSLSNGPNLTKGMAAVAKEQEAAKKRSQDKAKADKDSTSELAKGAKFAIGATAAMAGVRGGIDLAKLAMGYRGMAYLSAIEQRAALQLRQLFRGVDPMPVIKGADRFLQIFNKASVTGHALEGIFTRSFNAIFGQGEKLGDVAHTAFQGFVVAALYVELYALKAKNAMQPLIDKISDAGSGFDTMKIAAYAGGAAFAYLAYTAGAAALSLPIALAKMGAAAITGSARLVTLGVSATGAAAPFIALAAAIGGVALALDQAIKLSREWDSEAIKKSKLKEGSKEAEAAYGIKVGEQKKRVRLTKNAAGEWVDADDAGPATPAQPKGGAAPAMAKGTADGKAFADGVVKGAQQGTPAVDAAGRALAGAADQGFRSAAEIHSPSEVGKRSGRQIPAGVAIGVDQGTPQVQAAADRMMPTLGGGGSAGAAATGGGPVQITIVNQWPAGVAPNSSLEQAAEAAIYKAIRAVNLTLARPVGVP